MQTSTSGFSVGRLLVRCGCAMAVGAWLTMAAWAGGPPSAGDVGGKIKDGVDNATGAARDAATTTANKVRDATGNMVDEVWARGKFDELKRLLETKGKELSKALHTGALLKLQQKMQQMMRLNQARSTDQRRQLDTLKAQRAAQAAANAGGAGAVKPNPAGGATVKPGVMAKPADAGNAAPAPRITGLDRDEGQQDDWVRIVGTGLTADMEVHFRLSNTRDEKATVCEFWDSTTVVTRVPNLAQLPPFAGVIYVKRADGQVSNNQPFRYTPRCKYVLVGEDFIRNNMELSREGDDNHFTGFSDGATRYCVMSHSGFLLGRRGNDTFARNLRLKNGWVVESVDFACGADENNRPAGARIEESHPATDQLKIVVHWWFDPYFFGVTGGVDYALEIYLKGPEDLPWE